MRLEDLRIIVTGASGGLGRHFVLELLRAGARVAAGDTNAAGLRALKNEAEGLPGQLMMGKLDVTDEASAGEFVAAAAEQLGGLNALINSAGILRDGLLVHREGEAIHKLTLAQWRKVLDVNLTGPFLMTRELAARMLADAPGGEPTKGVVVNLSSLSRGGNPGQSNYAASKGGLDSATRTWALELAPYGIRVGAVAPGVTETGFLQGISDEALGTLVGSIPVGRAGRPEEIWMAVRFILECDFFNGRVLEVDGGARMA
jgi:3-oxoacyl-[acyl-carrier protein] reductase